MALNITIPFDAELRKSIRETILGEIKGIARDDLMKGWRAEVENHIQKHIFPSLGATVDTVIVRAVKTVLMENWSTIGHQFKDMVEKAIADAARLTVEKAAKEAVERGFMDNKIQEMIRSEVKKTLRGIGD